MTVMFETAYITAPKEGESKEEMSRGQRRSSVEHTSSKEAPPPKIFHPTLNISIEQPIDDVSYLRSPISSTTGRRPCL